MTVSAGRFSRAQTSVVTLHRTVPMFHPCRASHRPRGMGLENIYEQFHLSILVTTRLKSHRVRHYFLRRQTAFQYLVLCSLRHYRLLGLKPARCQESAARTEFINPLSRHDAADGRFQANPTGGGQEAVGFVARRQRMYPYAILLAPRPQPLGPPSTRSDGGNRALG